MISCVCQNCGITFEDYPSHVRSGRKYCSPHCYADYVKSHGNKLFFDGKWYRTNAFGYYVSCDKKPKSLHRTIWENANGIIPKGYIVHHKDGNKQNNTIENLELIEWGEHTIMHKTKHIHCTVEGCQNPHQSNGLCAKHLARRKHDELGHW